METVSPDRGQVAARLRAAGCIAAEVEAGMLARAAGTSDELKDMIRRREDGEPLAWITRSAIFAGLRIDPGVYVPRPHTEPLALEAARMLPPGGLAVDLCTGSGAIAAAMLARVAGARVVAIDIDARAVACARANGVDALPGDLDQPLPLELRGLVDVVTACPPYVPDGDLHLLTRDVRAREPLFALAGATDGLDTTRRCVEATQRLLRPGGSLLLEIGGRQAGPLGAVVERHGLTVVRVGRDEDGYDRFLHATAGR